MASRYWKEAASLIIVGRAAKSGVKKYSSLQTDYNLLFLKRSQKSKFMPNAFVFPGGVAETIDFSQKWLEIFQKCGYTADDLYRSFRNKAPLPELYSNKSDDCILPEVGFRINAIRETFEECGLLLASHQQGPGLSAQDLEEWRKAVHKDAVKFLDLFQEIGGCPAIWDLHEWMIWLTPTNMTKRRFDTAFFLTFMDTIPNLTHDAKEISEVQISSPLGILKQWHRGDLWLPPPQLYEISRLLQFTTFDKLKEFAQERGKQGLERFLPVRINTSDGVISALPGDDLYPDTIDLIGDKEIQEIETSNHELRMNAKHLNRIEFVRKGCHIATNVSQKYGHVQPIDWIELYKKAML